MLELRSNWTYYSLWFKYKIPHATKYTIEPEKVSLKVDKKFLKLVIDLFSQRDHHIPDIQITDQPL